MEQKYYTPSIEEIYFGFEFEVYNSKEKFFFEAEDGWYKTTQDFGVLGNITNIQRLLLDKQIRVKCLDKDDIESLGFRQGRLYPDKYASDWTWTYFHKDEIEISFYKDPLQKVDISNGKSYDECETYFQGIIKNKSELKKILKMIGA